MEKTPGVVVRNKFVSPNEVSNYSGMLNYQNKKAGRRETVLQQYEQYEEYVESYMANPEKATGLFTEKKDNLTKEEVDKYKTLFMTAQRNGSLLWQPVISFENSFLVENGLYDPQMHKLDERRMKNYIRNGVRKMLHNENLDHAVWTASFHYNTDNIHAHIAIVEPDPIRRKKVFERGGKLSEEYVGRFKLSSMKKCRSYLTNAILGEKNVNIQINDLIRKSIIQKKKDTILHRELKFRDQFLTIYDRLPEQKNRWNYNDSLMRALRPELDELSRKFMLEYQYQEFLQLKELMWQQNEIYEGIYGKNTKKTNYVMNKTSDLYTRLGNTILKEMKAYDDVLQEESLKRKMPETIVYEELPELEIMGEDVLEMYGEHEEVIHDLEAEDLYMKWTEAYKEARRFLYGTKEQRPDLRLAFDKMSLEAEFGNINAIYDMGEIYCNGKGVSVDLEKADLYYKKALRGMELLRDEGIAANKKIDYITYRIGKMYYLGKGTEKNLEKAYQMFSSSSSIYAKYTLGLMYRNGEFVERNIEKAYQCFEDAARHQMPYAAYEAAKICENNISAERREKAESYYKIARDGFEKYLNDTPDDRLFYRLGSMYEFGMGTKGTEVDTEKAVEYYERAAYLGNTQANAALARIYLNRGELDMVKLAITYLEKACEGKDPIAQYKLGTLYLKPIPEIQHIQMGLSYLEKSFKQGNQYAAYQLGKFYLTAGVEYRDAEKAEIYLDAISEKNMEAKYLLGKIYADQSGKKYDPKKAEQFFKEVKESGSVLAERSRMNLGRLYMDKKSPLYDRMKAIECFRPLAERENAEANLMLGVVYLSGDRSLNDVKKGKGYLKKAERLGNVYAKEILKNVGKKSSRNLTHHNRGQLNEAMSALRKSLKKESQKAINEYEFERTMNQELLIE